MVGLAFQAPGRHGVDHLTDNLEERAAKATGQGCFLMTKRLRIFTASLATETNTFSPVPTDRASFEMAFYAGPGKHPDTPTLCSSPMVVLRKRAERKPRYRGRHRYLGRAWRLAATADL
jgi:hypothetical protein